jgi:HlyD family secretion protein
MTVSSPPDNSPLLPRARFFVVVAIVGTSLITWGVYGHWRRDAMAARTQSDTVDSVPALRIAIAQREDGPMKITLPGQTEPFDVAAIHARATGYIAERHVDIGSRVRKGDLMVRISAPDLDAQLAQAKAQLVQDQAAAVQAAAQARQAEANKALARVTNSRTATLAKEGWESHQQADTTLQSLNAQTAALAAAQAAENVAVANINAQRATIDRLEKLTGYEQVTAPFDGVVTSRSVDVGDLVSADANGGTPLFTVQNDNILRVSVQVPQSEAVGIRNGLHAELSVPEIPGQTVHGTISRSSVSLSDLSRTLTVEVDVPDPQHRLRAGLYADVTLEIPRLAPSVIVPDEALVYDASTVQVFVIGTDRTVRSKTVSVARDFGTESEIRSGLQGGEQVVLSPPADLANGTAIHVMAPPPTPGAHPTTKPAANVTEVQRSKHLASTTAKF